MRAIKLALIFALILLPSEAFADGGIKSSVNTVMSTFQTAMQQWTPALTQNANRLLYLLGFIEFMLAGFRLVIRNADISEIVADLINVILVLGFFQGFVTNSVSWFGAIFLYFTSSANAVAQSTGATIINSPGDIAAMGGAICGTIWSTLSMWSPGQSFAYIIAGIINLICMVLMAAELIMATIEMYVIEYAGVIFLGFGGSRFSRDHAIKIISASISVGTKLFIVQLFCTMAFQILSKYSTADMTSLDNAILMVVVSVLFYALTTKVPALIQGLISGASISGGAGLIGATAQVGAAAGGAVLAATATGAVAAQRGAEAHKGGASIGSSIAQGLKAGAKAAGNDIGGRLSGDRHFGTVGGRILKNKDKN